MFHTLDTIQRFDRLLRKINVPIRTLKETAESIFYEIHGTYCWENREIDIFFNTYVEETHYPPVIVHEVAHAIDHYLRPVAAKKLKNDRFLWSLRNLWGEVVAIETTNRICPAMDIVYTPYSRKHSDDYLRRVYEQIGARGLMLPDYQITARKTVDKVCEFMIQHLDS